METLVEEGDLIEIDVMARKLNIFGVKGEKKTPKEVEAVLKERRQNWKPKNKNIKGACCACLANMRQAR